MALTPGDVSALRRHWRISRALIFPISLFVAAVMRLRFRYRLPDNIAELRSEIWKKLDAHDGPVIWAANHLTLIDSFLVYWAVFPLSRIGQDRRIPWSTPEYTNYYRLGSPWKSALLRGFLYACRCIPFLRGGEDEASAALREKAFDKCVWLLRHGASVFVYPEAGRSRSGWFEAARPKDFLGRLALAAPNAKFLCVYLRSENQIGTSTRPPDADRLRLVMDLIDGARHGQTKPREISQRLFDHLSEMQGQWWACSAMARNCAGNDIIDLKTLDRENFSDDLSEADPEWLDRHLTQSELAFWKAQAPGARFRTFWRFFCAKEACHKALARAGLLTARGGFQEIEVRLFRRKAVHRITGLELDVRFTDDDEDKLHCLAVLRGGFIGDDETPGDVIWDVSEVPAGTSAGEFVRERALELIASCNDEIATPARLALSDKNGLPCVFWKGKPQDWSLSLSHSGRYAASSFMIS